MENGFAKRKISEIDQLWIFSDFRVWVCFEGLEGWFSQEREHVFAVLSEGLTFQVFVPMARIEI